MHGQKIDDRKLETREEVQGTRIFPLQDLRSTSFRVSRIWDLQVLFKKNGLGGKAPGCT